MAYSAVYHGSFVSNTARLPNSQTNQVFSLEMASFPAQVACLEDIPSRTPNYHWLQPWYYDLLTKRPYRRILLLHWLQLLRTRPQSGERNKQLGMINARQLPEYALRDAYDLY